MDREHFSDDDSPMVGKIFSFCSLHFFFGYNYSIYYNVHRYRQKLGRKNDLPKSLK